MMMRRLIEVAVAVWVIAAFAVVITRGDVLASFATKQSALERAAARVADQSPPASSPLSGAQRARFATMPHPEGAVPVLAYRAVRTDLRHGAIAPRELARHLAMLEAAGFETIDLGRLEAAMQGRAQLPPNPLVLTFDDGTRGHWRFADPLLARHDMRAAEFVMPEAVARHSPYYLTRAELERMQESGRWEVHRGGRVAGVARASGLRLDTQPGARWAELAVDRGGVLPRIAVRAGLTGDELFETLRNAAPLTLDRRLPFSEPARWAWSAERAGEVRARRSLHFASGVRWASARFAAGESRAWTDYRVGVRVERLGTQGRSASVFVRESREGSAVVSVSSTRISLGWRERGRPKVAVATARLQPRAWHDLAITISGDTVNVLVDGRTRLQRLVPKAPDQGGIALGAWRRAPAAASPVFTKLVVESLRRNQ